VTGGPRTGRAREPLRVGGGARPVGAVIPDARSYTTIAGMVSADRNRFSISSTSVDSALPGRNDALSFFWTSASLPLSGPTTPPTTSHSRTTTTAPASARGPARRDGGHDGAPVVREARYR
jgi:hypothetical protein